MAERSVGRDLSSATELLGRLEAEVLEAAAFQEVQIERLDEATERWSELAVSDFEGLHDGVVVSDVLERVEVLDEAAVSRPPE